MANRSWSGPVWTGLETGKDRKRPVYTGPIRFLGHPGISRTGLGLGLSLLRLKTETGPDFRTLIKSLLNVSFIVHSPSDFKIFLTVLEQQEAELIKTQKQERRALREKKALQKAGQFA